MYYIYAQNLGGGGQIPIEAPMYDGNAVCTGTVADTINQIPSISMRIWPENPAFGKLKDMLSQLTAYNTITKENEFFGRVISSAETIDSSGYLCMDIVGEGALGFLCDGVYSGVSESVDTPGTFASALLKNYNSQVEAWKRIQLGRVEIKTRRNFGSVAPFTNCWEALAQGVELAGGYLSIRREDGVSYLDWLELPDYVDGTNGVALGVNMTQFKRGTDPSTLCSRLWPFGALTTDTKQLGESQIWTASANTTVYNGTNKGTSIGNRLTGQTAQCLGYMSGCWLIRFSLGSGNDYAVGFVDNAGGTSFGPSKTGSYKTWKSDKDADVRSYTSKGQSVGTISSGTTAWAYGTAGSMTAVVFSSGGYYKAGFVSDDGGANFQDAMGDVTGSYQNFRHTSSLPVYADTYKAITVDTLAANTTAQCLGWKNNMWLIRKLKTGSEEDAVVGWVATNGGTTYSASNPGSPQTWENDSANKPLYRDTICAYGILNIAPDATAQCYGTVGGLYIVNTGGYVGLTDYSGGCSFEQAGNLQQRINIASVNNGLLYLEDPELVEKYGVINGTLIVDDADSPVDLKTLAIAELKRIREESWSVDVQAMDLCYKEPTRHPSNVLGSLTLPFKLGRMNKEQLQEFTTKSFKVGHKYRVTTDLLGFDEETRIFGKSTPIESPWNPTLTFGSNRQTISGSVASLSR